MPSSSGRGNSGSSVPVLAGGRCSGGVTSSPRSGLRCGGVASRSGGRGATPRSRGVSKSRVAWSGVSEAARAAAARCAGGRGVSGGKGGGLTGSA